MTIDEIKQILEMMRAHDVAEFELELEGTKLRVRKDHQPPPPAAPVAALMATVLPPAGVAPAPVVPSAAPAEANDAAGVELAVVTSPIVGTFYRSPSPETASFVDVGQVVRKGQTLCIIEAMKLMNEIESEYEGEVARIYVENGQPVQYGERLFAIKVG